MQSESNVTILEGVGLQITESVNSIILTRSKAGKRIDTIALIVGILSLPILAFSVGLLIYEIENNNLHIATAFRIGLLFVLGGYLFSFFLKGLNRKLLFGKFSLEKNQTEYRLTQRVNFKLIQQTFDLNSQLSINKKSNDVSLNLDDNELFELKELNDEQLKRVESIVAKMNG